jgi:hypothetical protein
MDKQRFALGLVAALTASLIPGCRKSPPGAGEAAESIVATRPVEQPGEIIARLHWLGRKRLEADTNAAHLMSIWNLPESAALGKQSLDKLALAPWRLLKGDAATNGAPTAFLRPLLDDLVREEFYLEVRNLTNRPIELVIAIHLNPDRAEAWRTNLPAVIQSLTGTPGSPTKEGWSLQEPNMGGMVELTRKGDWTVLGLAKSENGLLAETLGRIERNRQPYLTPASNHWLTLAVDLPLVAEALSLDWQSSNNLPRVSLAIRGDGANVHTRGELTFPGPLDLDMEPWSIPTNLIHDPLISFTAIRGIRPWVASIRTWQGLLLGEWPNQAYVWGLGSTPFQTYLAIPAASASNQVFQLSQLLMDKGNAWLADNAIGQFVKSDGINGVRWTGVPFITPNVQSVVSGDEHFIKVGFFPSASTNKPMPQELVYAVLTPTNLVGYDWEITAPRFDGWTGVGQALRISLDRPRMPSATASITWLRAIKPKLGNATTGVMFSNRDQFTLVRISSIGLTALELHLLADWLESPQFPRGLHTLLVASELPWRKQPPPAPPQP